MKLFITGASGFIGKVLLDRLCALVGQQDRIFILSRSAYHNPDKRVQLLKGSLETIEHFRQNLLESDYVFHIAANATFGRGIDYELTNFIGTQSIVDILKASKCLKKFIFTSTIGAVDRHASDRCVAPLNLESTPSPTSDYGRSKLKAEYCISDSGIPYVILRPTWVYGKNMRRKSHIAVFVSMAYRKSPLMHFCFPGKVSLIHVDDLAKALVNTMANGTALNKTYFAETESLSIGEIWRIVFTKVHNRSLLQLKIPSLRFFFGRLHSKLPLTVSNLFIDYLSAKDPAFRRDLLGDADTKQFQNDVEDVISF